MSQPIVPSKVKSVAITQADTFDMRWLPKYDDGMKRVRTIPIRAAKKEIEDVPISEDDLKEVSARPSVAPNGHDKRPNDRVIMPPEQNETVQNARGSGHFVPPVNKRRMKVAYVYKRDQRTCLRHDMRTVYYGKHRWRCRR